MFALSDADLEGRIVGCGDGPASFNVEATLAGTSVTSVDPLYRWPATAIRDRIDATYGTVIEQTRRNSHEFVWTTITSVEALGTIRAAAMARFLEDYELGRRRGRYLPAALPALPFRPATFDLSLCSHYLFLYSEHLTFEFHIDAIREMLRVAREVRVFPLLELGAIRSRHLDRLLRSVNWDGTDAEVRRVPYEFQRGGNEMLVVRRR